MCGLMISKSMRNWPTQLARMVLKNHKKELFMTSERQKIIIFTLRMNMAILMFTLEYQ